MESSLQDQASTQHSYGTRIRQNIIIKPSARLRQSPDPPQRSIRKIKPSPPAAVPSPPSNSSNLPVYPSPDVVLHPDDANSKVFMALARSFSSVDNRAMTIKDLAEMTVKFGLVCQNVSAASQAITTYIRVHLARCDHQQDQPVLARHTLSGTSADDNLLPALHSISGGSHLSERPQTKEDHRRSTNFRKGTMVWYLSRVTGAPCPFARAGIRLCDYVVGDTESAIAIGERKRQRKRERESKRLAAKVEHEQCGDKRKRHSTRTHRNHSPSSSSEDDYSSDDDSTADQPPPMKPKLTFKIPPLSRVTAGLAGSRPFIDSDNDSMDIDSEPESSSGEESEHVTPAIDMPHESCLPPYPRRSICIPPYTPCPNSPPRHHRVARSPSVAFSMASPPPDSEDEEDDFHVSMVKGFPIQPRRSFRRPSDDFDMEDSFGYFTSSDFDAESHPASSPGPRSPSAPILPPQLSRSPYMYPGEPRVKVEATDVQGILDAWEDLDNMRECESKPVVDVLGTYDVTVKQEDGLDWDWNQSYNDWEASTTSGSSPYSTASPPSSSAAVVKQEEQETVTFDPVAYASFHQYRSDPTSSPLVSPTSTAPPLSPEDIPPWHMTQALLSPYSEISQRRGSGVPDFHTPNYKTLSSARPRSKTVPSFGDISFSDTTNKSPWDLLAATAALPSTLASILEKLKVEAAAADTEAEPPCVSPREMDLRPWGTPSQVLADGAVIVKPCRPCGADVCATQVEGIAVYQIALGSYVVLRRIDTDFVNLTPILAYSNSPCPVLSTIPNVVLLNDGKPIIDGVWVPLSAAQAYVKDHPASSTPQLEIFLGADLASYFSSALTDFTENRKEQHLTGQFGKGFGTKLEARDLAATMPSVEGWEKSHVFLMPPPLAMSPPVECPPELPLSPTEQEMFHAFCVSPDWDKDGQTPTAATHSLSIRTGPSTPKRGYSVDAMDLDDDEPLTPITASPCSVRGESMEPEYTTSMRGGLRRSKRVADAVKSRPTRSRKTKS